MHAAAGRVSRGHPTPWRCWKRHVPGPSSRGARRFVVRAIRESEGAQAVSPSVPVPAGGPWVTPAWCQTWGGTGAQRPVVVSATLHGPRQRGDRARTGPSQAAERGESPGQPAAARAPPGTRAWPGGGEARSRGQGWRTPTLPLGPPSYGASRVRRCKAAAEVCKRRWSRPCGGARTPGRRASGSVKVTRQSGTGRRSRRCCASPRVVAACWHVGPGQCCQAGELSASAPPAAPGESGPPRAAVRHGAMASRAARGLGSPRSAPVVREAGPSRRQMAARARRADLPRP
jgi:hypothetical protein